MRRTYVRFPLDLKPEVLAVFRAACEKNVSLTHPLIRTSLLRFSVCARLSHPDSITLNLI